MDRNEIQPPADGRPLEVMVIGRVSRETQDVKNIQAGAADVEKYLRSIYSGPYNITVFGEQGSGMLRSRPEIDRAIEAIKSHRFDLVLMEDLSRAFRNVKLQIGFAYLCYDSKVRLIAMGDGIDTAVEGWNTLVSAAALKHGLMIDDTKRRINRTANYKFEAGGEVRKITLAYRKLTKEEAEAAVSETKGLRIAKDPIWTPWLQHIRQELVAGTSSVSQLVHWLNEQGARPTKYFTNCRITNRHLLELLRNPLLYGLREFRKVRMRYLYDSGEYYREKNSTPMQKLWPTLAHMTKEQWDELQAALSRLRKFDRKADSNHPRYHVARRRSILPNQLLTCSTCGGLYYPAGKDALKCMNSRAGSAEPCWNHTQVAASRVRAVIVDALIRAVESSSEARDALKAAAWREVERLRTTSGGELNVVERQLAEVQLQSRRIVAAIKAGADLDAFMKELAKLKKRVAELRSRQASLTARATSERLPMSLEQLDFDLQKSLLELAATSFDFADLIRRIMPKFEIQPVQALDTGQVRPRAVFVMDLSPLVTGGAPPQRTPRELIADLFDAPAHIRYLGVILEARSKLKSVGRRGGYDAIASATGQGRMTVKRAIAYDRLMTTHATTDPFVPLREPPVRASRWTQRLKAGIGEAALEVGDLEASESEFSDGMPPWGHDRINESAA